MPYISNDLLDHVFELIPLNYKVSVFYDFGLWSKKTTLSARYLWGKSTINIGATYRGLLQITVGHARNLGKNLGCSALK